MGFVSICSAYRDAHSTPRLPNLKSEKRGQKGSLDEVSMGTVATGNTQSQGREKSRIFYVAKYDVRVTYGLFYKHYCLS